MTQPANAFRVDGLIRNPGAKRQRGQQRNLLRRINAVHVETRIGFGISQGLGFPQHLLEIQPVVAHLAQDVIRRAVDDAGNGEKLIGYEAFFDGPDDRNTPTHAGFEPNIAPEGAGRCEDFAAVPRQQRFVGGDDMLALLQRRQQIGTCRFIPADQLNYNGNVRVVQHLQSVTRELG